MAQHQSQCSIFANQQVRVAPIALGYLTFSSVRAVFGRPLPGLRSVADPHSSASLQIAFTEQTNPLNPLPEILQQLFSIQNQVSAMSRSELYLHTIFYP